VGPREVLEALHAFTLVMSFIIVCFLEFYEQMNQTLEGVMDPHIL
jgi:hypothetical protein